MTLAPSPVSLPASVAIYKYFLETLETEVGAGVASTYETFKRRYWDDPSGFVNDCIVWGPKDRGPADYQEDVLRLLGDHKRVSVRGPHGLGKTTLAAWILLWFALTRDGLDWKIPTTASAWRQLTKFLWPEIRKWAGRVNWEKVGRPALLDGKELLRESLKLSTGEAFALASNQPALIEGAHADHILYVFDEAKAIPAETWDAAEGAMSTGDARWVCISTPGEPSGRFFEIQTRRPGYEDWAARRVTVEQAIAAGRITREWANARRTQWGEDSPMYRNRVLGEFAESGQDSIIPLAWIEAANERWHAAREAALPPFTGVGVDVARYGDDDSVMALRYGRVIAELRRTSRRSTMETTGQVVGILDALGGYASVDVIGIGAGVVDRLRELGKNVVAFNASSRSKLRDVSGELGFLNRRAAGWWNLREMLDPERGYDLALPPDDMLTGDLTAPRWSLGSGGAIRIEDKDEIKKRLGRSPDAGEAVMQIFCPPEPVDEAPPPKRAGAWGRR